jgi:hypothetical protein
LIDVYAHVEQYVNNNNMESITMRLVVIFFLIFTWVDALSVGVWDDVLSPEAIKYTHEASKQLGSNKHFLFSRPLDTKKSGSIERVLDSILTELGDESTYVEYWTRQEWRSIEAHADVDEFRAKKEDLEGNNSLDFRYPVNGHVLYLQRGSEVRGPTCIFPDRSSGGDLLKAGKASDSVEVVSVPVVPGRLLRFRGDYIHAVPRPHDLWFLKFIQGAPKYDPEEEWGRSVVLFNSWGNAPPMDVSENDSTNDSGKIQKERHECQKVSKWSEVYMQPDANVTCQNYEETEMLAAKIWLLGNERRREHPMRTLKLLAPTNARSAMAEESTVSHFFLKQVRL